MKRKRNGKNASLDTFIGANTVLEGTIYTDSSVCIEGRIRGGIKAKGEVLVGCGGEIEADVEADSVVVGGQIVGNIHARSRLEITATGRVTGDVEAAKITLTEGGMVDGSFKMIEVVGKEPAGVKEFPPFRSNEAT